MSSVIEQRFVACLLCAIIILTSKTPSLLRNNHSSKKVSNKVLEYTEDRGKLCCRVQGRVHGEVLNGVLKDKGGVGWGC
jgi:hypothetical protein